MDAHLPPKKSSYDAIPLSSPEYYTNQSQSHGGNNNGPNSCQYDAMPDTHLAPVGNECQITQNELGYFRQDTSFTNSNTHYQYRVPTTTSIGDLATNSVCVEETNYWLESGPQPGYPNLWAQASPTAPPNQNIESLQAYYTMPNQDLHPGFTANYSESTFQQPLGFEGDQAAMLCSGSCGLGLPSAWAERRQITGAVDYSSSTE
ncbi:hypothetical protein GQ44DRAFT_774993 [Phaeosphaeriaceae sp. PMI808]|nr:hypothetical protein GQ44DRAFT_774993 [Phaeosphaeriaceae sp. PMI808]